MNISKLTKLIIFLENNFNVNIDKKTFMFYLYHLNLLIYKLYIIYKDTTITYKQKIKKISNLRDTEDKKFLTDKQSKFILDNYAKDIFNLYTELYKLRLSNYKMKGGNKIGKHINKINIKINQLSTYLDNPEIKKNGKLIFNWIFFPLWSFENTTMGPLIGVPLDIISIILDNLDIIMEEIAPLIPIAIDVLLDIGQAIPAYGTAVSAIALPFNFIEEPIEDFFANFTDIIGMFLNISRKQWSLAYMSALASIPLFSDLMDSVMTNLYVSNKWLNNINVSFDRFNRVVVKITNNINNYEVMFENILENPLLLFKPQLLLEYYFNNTNISSKQSDKFIKEISTNKSLLTSVKTNYNTFSKNPDTFIDTIIKPFLDNIPNKNKLLSISNNILETINNLL